MIDLSRTRTIMVAASVLAVFSAPAFAQAPAAHQHEASDAMAAEAPFLAENDAAMTKMMNDMAVTPTGDVDRDFVSMMAPHHQGAIDMAKTYLRYGNNETLKRLAQEIIVTQQQEIAAMRLALGDPLPPSTPSPTQTTQSQPSPLPTRDHSSMPAGMKMDN